MKLLFIFTRCSLIQQIPGMKILISLGKDQSFANFNGEVLIHDHYKVCNMQGSSFPKFIKYGDLKYYSNRSDVLSDEEFKEIKFFGIWKSNLGWRPVLWRPQNKWSRCSGCSGFGSSGNPLIGKIHSCSKCNGTGYSRIWKILKFFKLT